MQHGRTGRRSRLAFAGGMPGQGCVGAGVNALLVLLALGTLAVLGVLSLEGLVNLFSPESTLHRLTRAPTATDARLGRVHLSGSIRGQYPQAVCEVQHQHYVSGKNGGWRTDNTALLGEGASFESGSRAWFVDVTALRFDPEEWYVVADGGLEAVFRRRSSHPEGGRLRYQCAHAGEVVFVEACAPGDGETLAGCADGGRLTLTVGDGTAAPRVRSHANTTAAFLALGVSVLYLLALYLGHVLRAGSLVEVLRSWNSAPPTPKRAYVFAGIVAIPLLAWLVVAYRAATRSGSQLPAYLVGYGFGATVVAVLLITLVMAWDRRRLLDLAMQPIRETETTRLARVGDGPAELAVRVRRDAPTVPLPGHSPRAWVFVDVKQVIQVGKNFQTVPLHRASWPARIPVEDPTGQGVLQLGDATVDTRATFRTVTGADAQALLVAYAATPFGSPQLQSAHTLTLQVEENYIDPGESLYLLGRIQRVHDPKADASYREMGTVPIISYDDSARLVVHAGSERSLLDDLTRERKWQSAMIAGLAVGSFLLTTALVYLRALA